ncbi:hypothetical protein, partial [Candidatus Magnetobacterium casense]
MYEPGDRLIKWTDEPAPGYGRLYPIITTATDDFGMVIPYNNYISARVHVGTYAEEYTWSMNDIVGPDNPIIASYTVTSDAWGALTNYSYIKSTHKTYISGGSELTTSRSITIPMVKFTSPQYTPTPEMLIGNILDAGIKQIAGDYLNYTLKAALVPINETFTITDYKPSSFVSLIRPLSWGGANSGWEEYPGPYYSATLISYGGALNHTTDYRFAFPVSPNYQKQMGTGTICHGYAIVAVVYKEYIEGGDDARNNTVARDMPSTYSP